MYVSLFVVCHFKCLNFCMFSVGLFVCMSVFIVVCLLACLFECKYVCMFLCLPSVILNVLMIFVCSLSVCWYACLVFFRLLSLSPFHSARLYLFMLIYLSVYISLYWSSVFLSVCMSVFLILPGFSQTTWNRLKINSKKFNPQVREKRENPNFTQLKLFSSIRRPKPKTLYYNAQNYTYIYRYIRFGCIKCDCPHWKCNFPMIPHALLLVVRPLITS